MDPTGSSRSTKGTKKTASKSKAAETVPRLRGKLRRIDREIVGLLNERANVASKLAIRAQRSNSNRDTPTNDRDQISRSSSYNKGPLSDDSVRCVFREIVSGCRSLVRDDAIAFLGPKFSYTHLAAIHRFGQNASLVPVTSIPAVFEAVIRGDATYGVVPLENSTDGRIADTLDVFARTPVRISGEVQLRIHHNLLGKCERSDVRVVCSKPQALSQCRQWIAKHLPGVQTVETASTTAAAERAAHEAGVAAVASMQASVNYGLRVLARSIEDNRENVTRFAIIGNQPAEKSGQDITSIMFKLSHEPGALADAMAIFKRNRLNLTWIESFPLVGSPNEYLFFVELEGFETDLRVRRAIGALEKKTERLEILGCYGRCQPVDR